MRFSWFLRDEIAESHLHCLLLNFVACELFFARRNRNSTVCNDFIAIVVQPITVVVQLPTAVVVKRFIVVAAACFDQANVFIEIVETQDGQIGHLSLGRHQNQQRIGNVLALPWNRCCVVQGSSVDWDAEVGDRILYEELLQVLEQEQAAVEIVILLWRLKIKTLIVSCRHFCSHDSLGHYGWLIVSDRRRIHSDIWLRIPTWWNSGCISKLWLCTRCYSTQSRM